MNAYLDEFSNYLKVTKNSSANTIDAYLRDIKQFYNYCDMNGTSDIKIIDEEYIKKYFDYIKFLGKSNATKTRVIASVRCYFAFLFKEDLIKYNPTENLKNPRNVKSLPGILDSSEILKLLSAPKGDSLKAIRDRAMLELLYATGIRVSELIELKKTDINLEVGIISISNSKGERVIPIYPAAVKHLKEYFNKVRPALIRNKSEESLFVNMTGQTMSRQGCWKLIKYYANECGINGDITPHTLRHSFAAHLLENGAQLKDIKDMLGHSDISSTHIYTDIIKSKYIKSYSKFHPLAKG